MAVILTTNMGKIKIELLTEQAPKTVDNFISYVKSGHYNGTIFHRVINGFMIQGGCQKQKAQSTLIAHYLSEFAGAAR